MRDKLSIDFVWGEFPMGHGDRFPFQLANDNRSTLNFEGAGLYAVDIVWFDWFGGLQIRWFGSVPGVDRHNTPPGLAGIVPTRLLYASAVPEPGSLISVALGSAGLAVYTRWRRVCVR